MCKERMGSPVEHFGITPSRQQDCDGREDKQTLKRLGVGKAAGTAPLEYPWMKAATTISGATPRDYTPRPHITETNHSHRHGQQNTWAAYHNAATLTVSDNAVAAFDHHPAASQMVTSRGRRPRSRGGG